MTIFDEGCQYSALLVSALSAPTEKGCTAVAASHALPESTQDAATGPA